MTRSKVDMVENTRKEKVHVKCTLTGTPAAIIRELKERGIVASVREAITHGLISYYDEVLKRDLDMARLQASRRLNKTADL